MSKDNEIKKSGQNYCYDAFKQHTRNQGNFHPYIQTWYIQTGLKIILCDNINKIVT